MVVFVDLDQDAFDNHHFSVSQDALLHRFAEPRKSSLSKLMGTTLGLSTRSADADMATNDANPPSTDATRNPSPSPTQQTPPSQTAFSAALSCYPYATLADQAIIGPGSVLCANVGVLELSRKLHDRWT
jgi:hypothetical protein